MKSVKQLLGASVFAICLITQAHAVSTESKTRDIGSLSGGGIGTFLNNISSNSTFSDSLNFSLSSLSNITGVFAVLNIPTFAAEIDGPGGFMQTINFDTPTLPVLQTGHYSFSGLASGDYTMKFFGSTASAFGGSYANVFSVAAVPEADTWAMILIGAGLVMLQLRRKQKSLLHQPFTA